jgi:hypothetical protein
MGDALAALTSSSPICRSSMSSISRLIQASSASLAMNDRSSASRRRWRRAAARSRREPDVEDWFGCHGCRLVYDRRLHNPARPARCRLLPPPPSAIPTSHDRPRAFIWSAYAVALFGLGGLVVASLLARRR